MWGGGPILGVGVLIQGGVRLDGGSPILGSEGGPFWGRGCPIWMGRPIWMRGPILEAGGSHFGVGVPIRGGVHLDGGGSHFGGGPILRKGSFWVGSLLEGGVPFWEWGSQCGWEVPFWGCPIWMGGPILGAGGGSHFEGDPIIWGEVPFWGCLSWMGGLISGVGKGGESIRMGGSHFEEGPISGGGVPL